MSSRLLTIGISEMMQSQSMVVTIDLDDYSFYGLNLAEDVISGDGTISWDLFGVTEGFDKLEGDNEIQISKPEVKDYYSKNQMIEIFERRRKPIREFFETKPDYCIMRLDNIQKLDKPFYKDINGRKVFRQYIYFGTNARRRGPERLLIKDYRWVEYWRNIPESLWEEKTIHWEKHLKGRSQGVYAIGQAMHFEKPGKRIWICGLHCL